MGKTACLVDLKFDRVTLPSFSMLVSYLDASGLRLGLMKVSSEPLWPMDSLGPSLNLLVELRLGL